MLRPSVPFLALLVVACMIVVAPASAAWKTHRAPAAERAALALRATNGQAVEAKRTAGRIDRQLQDLRREQTRLTLVERAARAELVAAAPATGGRATALLVMVAGERRALERTRRQLRADQTAGAGDHHGERSARAFFGMPPQITRGSKMSVSEKPLQILPNVTSPQSAQWSEGNAIFNGVAKTT